MSTVWMVRMVPGRDETTTDSVGQGDRLREVVGHEDNGRLRVGPQPEQLLVEHELPLGVQGPEGFVHEQGLRPVDQGTSEDDCLRMPPDSSAR